MARIISPYAKGTAPGIAARWEKHVEEADSDAAAQLQLTYNMLLQLRAIKLLLLWVLVIVPIIARSETEDDEAPGRERIRGPAVVGR